MGSYLHPDMVKKKILESYAEFESFCSKCIGVALEPIVELHSF